MLERLLLFTVFYLPLITLSAQSEAYYAGRLVDERENMADRVIEFEFDGEMLTVPTADVLDHLVAGNDIETLPALDAMRARDGHDVDSTERLSDDARRSIMIQLKRAVDSVRLSSEGQGSALEGNAAEGTESMLPGNKEAAILDAVAQVIVDRVKEELALAYFDKMAVKMDDVHVLHHACHDPMAPQGMCTLTELMPATQLIFKESRDHISSHVGATLKAAFVDDLEKFTSHFSEAYGTALSKAEASTCKALLTNEDYAVLMAARLVNGIARRHGWMDILEELSRTEVEAIAWKKRGAAIDLAIRLLESMQDAGSADFIELRIGEWSGDRLNAYMGLLLLNPNVKSDLHALGIDHVVRNKYEMIRGVLRTADALRKTAEELKDFIDPKVSEDKGSHFARYAGLVVEFISDGNAAVRQLATEWAAGAADPDRLLPANFDAYVEAAIGLHEAVVNKDYGKASLQVLRTLNAALPADSILDHDLVKLVTLAADIAEAGNGEVKGIFEAAIMPVGSFRVKQSTSFSATLNAYPGIFFGAETLQGSNGTKGFGGVAGPIGVALSWSKGNERTLRASNTLMLGIIDIGALLTYRFDTEDSVSANSQVAFSTVLAPGLFALHGFKGSPISCGFGVQYAPRLRGVATDAIDLAPADALRIGAAIAVDIPLFPLSLRRRPVKPLADDVRATEAELKELSGQGGNTACVERRLKRRKGRLYRALR
ncbi:MAG: hypothetical protein IPL52_07600 [Flavobacteriales bacterium]|nr:hypothetical protein [Flavobacteriales bacterium]